MEHLLKRKLFLSFVKWSLHWNFAIEIPSAIMILNWVSENLFHHLPFDPIFRESRMMLTNTENCVVHSDGSLRLIDFAYAVDFSDPSTPIRSYHGSPAYAAPEVLFHQPHDASVDIYSLGTCLYYMLCGSFPFVKDETTTTFEQLCRNVKAFQLDFPPHLSEDVIDLLSRMITKKDRISWHEIATHPWVLGCALMDFDSGNRMSL